MHVASGNGDLGIEFCADRCRSYAYGGRPQIRDGEFTVCFYTSGEYVERVSDGCSSVDGYYHFNYGTEGDEVLNDVVAKTLEAVRRAKTPMPSPDPNHTPVPTPVPTPDPDDIPPAPDDSNWEKLYDNSDIFYYNESGID